MQEGHVGSKGELYPPKKILEELGLKPGSRVLLKAESGRLIVEPIHEEEKSEP